TGIDELLDAILLQAEVLELNAVRKGKASGAVNETFLDKGRGLVATVPFREGHLYIGRIGLWVFASGSVLRLRKGAGADSWVQRSRTPVWNTCCVGAFGGGGG
ncbi:hypothetical protein, partial [Escherichia coli]|uniref:hypothetical protein n=1 Tax=Escherichia coli TaxID=562 RepID=UPI00207B3A79